jgi:hypothetical protein
MRRAVVAWMLAAGCSDPGGPRLVSVDPAAVPRGQNAMITGEHLCGTHGDCSKAGGYVQIGVDPPVVQASIVTATDSTLRISIPTVTPVGPTSLVATIDNRSSNALDFEVLP